MSGWEEGLKPCRVCGHEMKVKEGKLELKKCRGGYLFTWAYLQCSGCEGEVYLSHFGAFSWLITALKEKHNLTLEEVIARNDAYLANINKTEEEIV